MTDQFDRGLRQHVAQKMADEENRHYGPSKRGRGSLLPAVVLIILFALGAVLITSGSTAGSSAGGVDGLCVEQRPAAAIGTGDEA